MLKIEVLQKLKKFKRFRIFVKLAQDNIFQWVQHLGLEFKHWKHWKISTRLVIFTGSSINHSYRISYRNRNPIRIPVLLLSYTINCNKHILRDVKPGNYTIGRPELNELRKVYVLDFGMCRKFTNAQVSKSKRRKNTSI